MMDLSNPQGNTKPDENKTASASAGGYKSRLDAILAKAGSNNPIAAAQSKTAQPPATQPAAPVSPAVPPVAATPVPPAGPAQTAPQNPNDRLQQILAMAGQTPAQRAQTQAQQNQAASAANIQAMLQAYMQSVAQDPRKVLKCDIEFQANPGANDELYFKCYADQNNNIYWDVFGLDISHVIPTRIGNYQLYDDYYKGVTHADFMADMATATVHSHQVV